MPTTNFKNLTIKEKEDKHSKPYYLIINTDNKNEAYFCFRNNIRESNWNELVKNWKNIKREIEIEFEEINDGIKTRFNAVNIYTSITLHKYLDQKYLTPQDVKKIVIGENNSRKNMSGGKLDLSRYVQFRAIRN